MGNIVWLASYPKSGNTWLRVFLANYVANCDQPISINEIVGDLLCASRSVFDSEVGISSAHLTPAEIDYYRPAFHTQLAAQFEKPSFIKIHDAYTHNSAGKPLFPKAATAGVIYLIRNPLDVAVSYAHHCAWPIKRTICEMNHADSTLARSDKQLSQGIHQQLQTWSGHVRSWTAQTELPILVVRYEDMLQSPTETFGEIVDFVGLPVEPMRLARAIDFSTFKNLHAQEKQHSFIEKSPMSQSFFRSGTIGSWRTQLTAEEAELLISHHGSMMQKFGYLDAG